METIARPEMKLIKQEGNLKTYRITAKAGMQMPDHHSTSEVAIIVEEGEATITFGKDGLELKAGKPIIIPAGKTHSLFIHSNFAAIAVMANTAEIKFEENISSL
ncbi:MAG: cupin domain-containing protein [Parafilimonas sp.]